MSFLKPYGRVVGVGGYSLRFTGIDFSVGSYCEVRHAGIVVNRGVVVKVSGSESTLFCFKEVDGVGLSSVVMISSELSSYRYSSLMNGSVIDCYSRNLMTGMSFDSDSVGPSVRTFSDRRSVDVLFDTGVSSLNCFVPIGYGQRIGLFAGSGVGKSVLLSMVAKASQSDFCVCALIGERSREIVDFMNKTLNEETRKKTIIVAESAQSSPLEKIRATELAIRIAEREASKGKRVVFLFDSLTRYAHALREYGLASGEVPTLRGYPPSVFSKIPSLIERAGNFSHGSITGIFTVLMDGDDENDPVVDTARAILDGHIMMSRKLAARGVFPAIDICKSVSRCAGDIVSHQILEKSNHVRSLVSVRDENADLITMGAYTKGTNPLLDEAVAKNELILSILKQSPSERRGVGLSHQYLFGV